MTVPTKPAVIVHRAFRPELKDTGLPPGVGGQVSGLALVYDVLDSHGSTFARGALERTMRERVAAGKVKLFLDHGDSPITGMYDTHLHIGTVQSLTDVQLDDGRWGAYMVANLFTTPEAMRAKEYIQGVLATGGETGLSVGAMGELVKHIKSHVVRINGEPVERITEFPLSEISITSMQSVPDSEVLAVRAEQLTGSEAALILQMRQLEAAAQQGGDNTEAPGQPNPDKSIEPDHVPGVKPTKREEAEPEPQPDRPGEDGPPEQEPGKIIVENSMRFNPNHEPAGSPQGGEFTTGGGSSAGGLPPVGLQESPVVKLQADLAEVQRKLAAYREGRKQALARIADGSDDARASLEKIDAEIKELNKREKDLKRIIDRQRVLDEADAHTSTNVPTVTLPFVIDPAPVRADRFSLEAALDVLLHVLPHEVLRAKYRAVLGNASPADTDATHVDRDAASEDSRTTPAHPAVVYATMDERITALRHSYTEVPTHVPPAQE